ncbi:hypothetical protein BC835DRAFT_1031759 [Cytidiella melzeri]|nr:hypothetical protein BC835DRAFT_1031759 [Cytidiella melzeri]
MQPVVSVLRFTASACPSKERKLTEAVRLVSEIDGAQQGCWGFEVGKCNSGCIVQVWQSLQHHKELLHHANFSGIRDALAACFSEQPTLSHVVFDNKSTALDQPVLHILRAQTPLAHSEMECKIRRIVDKIGKTAFGGQSLENPDVHFVFIGTATVEVRLCSLAHLTYFLSSYLICFDSGETPRNTALLQ